MTLEEYYNEIDKGTAAAKGNIAYYQEGEELLKGRIAELVLENDQLKKVIAAQKQEWGDGKGEDRPLSIQDRIDKADPIYTKDYDTYETALNMVGAKRSKYGLVDLVNYLLSVIKKWEARVKELEGKQRNRN